MQPWFRFRRLAGLPLFCAFYWPCRWQGWIALFFLGLLWLGVGSHILFDILPSNPSLGWGLFPILFLVCIALQYLFLKYAGKDAAKTAKPL